MHYSEVKHQRSLRRILGISGIILSLLILLGAIGYGVYGRLLFTTPNGKSFFSWPPAPASATCKTPAHQPGNSTSTIFP